MDYSIKKTVKKNSAPSRDGAESDHRKMICFVEAFSSCSHEGAGQHGDDLAPTPHHFERDIGADQLAIDRDVGIDALDLPAGVGHRQRAGDTVHGRKRIGSGERVGGATIRPRYDQIDDIFLIVRRSGRCILQGHVALEPIAVIAAHDLEGPVPAFGGVGIDPVAGPDTGHRVGLAGMRDTHAVKADRVDGGVIGHRGVRPGVLLKVFQSSAAEFERTRARVFGIHHQRTTKGGRLLRCRPDPAIAG